MANNHDKDIRTLVELFDDSDWRELSLKLGDLQLFLSKDPQAKPPAPNASKALADEQSRYPKPKSDINESTTTHLPTNNTNDDSETEGLVAIRAANVGTFYRGPKPGEAPYVDVGDSVTPETEVCLIEVMKLFTPQQAGVTGIVRKICIKDAQMVEYDQPLFYIEPT